MIIYPAIDLRQGRCVRLAQGRFDRETVYDRDPIEVARRFAASGATRLHVVDLDGAESEAARQTELLLAIARETPLLVQAGGGLRTEDEIRRLLEGGIARAVVGSIAVRDPALTISLIERFGGERIVLALDIRLDSGEALVETAGWQGGGGAGLADVLRSYAAADLRHVLCTDIARDGMLAGTDVAFYRRLCARHPSVGWIASGGISTLAELRALAEAGVFGAVVGKALYESRFTLEEALAC